MARQKSEPLSCKPKAKPDWKIEVGVDLDRRTFILWINGTDFRSLTPHVEKRSMNDDLSKFEAARGKIRKSGPNERGKM